MESPEFGPFAVAFEKGPRVARYLSLLHLAHEDEAQLAIDHIQAALADPEPQRWIEALLAGRDWRPHLPAAVAYLLDRGSRLQCGALWNAIDGGSWVTPQLVVSAFFSDPDFAKNVQIRVNRYLSTSADSASWNVPKVVASLMGAGALAPELQADIARWRDSDVLASLLRADDSWDQSDRIVLDWKALVEARFTSRGIQLARPVLKYDAG